MIGTFKVWYHQQLFDPGPLGWMVNPFYLARRGLHRSLIGLLSELRGGVLDVGCGRMPYRRFVRAERYTGLDYDTPARRADGLADVLYDGGRFPFPDAEFDGALCTQVLEHVFTPEQFLGEIHRVLRPGGALVLTVPFIWDEHEQPYDFGRYSSFGLKTLLERNGFEVLNFEKASADAGAIAQICAGWVYKLVARRGKVLRSLIQLLIIAPINLVGLLAAVILPRNLDFYLDNVVLARRSVSTPSRCVTSAPTSTVVS